LIWYGTRPRARRFAVWTIGMSFVVRIEGAETFVPALEPT
jgi:hypothetical protein